MITTGGLARADAPVPPSANEDRYVFCKVVMAAQAKVIFAHLRDRPSGFEAVSSKGKVLFTVVRKGSALDGTVGPYEPEPRFFAQAFEQCAKGEASFSFGHVKLPPGWYVVHQQGIDSDPGFVIDDRGNQILHFDIGAMAGFAVHPSSEHKWDFIRTERLGSATAHYGTASGKLYLTFDIGPSNFYGDAKDLERALAFFRATR